MLAASVAIAALVTGCALGPGAGPSSFSSTAQPSVAATPPPVVSGSPRASLPSGFPVLPGASSAPLPDGDPELIAVWTSDQPGSTAYDFYVVALPTAGYLIEGLYPGGEWAIIRFRLADGAIWQVLVHGTPTAPVEVQVRLDRP